MTTYFKPDVLLYGLRPEMLLVHLTVRDVFEKYGAALKVSSGRDSFDGRVNKTLHDAGTDEVPAIFALDYGAVHITNAGTQQAILKDLKEALPFCDVLLHAVVGSVIHYHIEFDPKNDPIFQTKKAKWKNGEKVVW